MFFNRVRCVCVHCIADGAHGCVFGAIAQHTGCCHLASRHARQAVQGGRGACVVPVRAIALIAQLLHFSSCVCDRAGTWSPVLHGASLVSSFCVNEYKRLNDGCVCARACARGYLFPLHAALLQLMPSCCSCRFCHLVTLQKDLPSGVSVETGRSFSISCRKRTKSALSCRRSGVWCVVLCAWLVPHTQQLRCSSCGPFWKQQCCRVL